MNPDASNESARMAAAFGQLLNAADRGTRIELLKCLGRHLLVKRPILEGLATPHADDFEKSWEEDSWIDAQLYDALPELTELENLDDWKYQTLEATWPDGFDEVVFNNGEDDADHARALVEAFLHKANELSLPVMTDFDSTDQEMEHYLQTQFVELIRKWRARVIEMLT